MTRRKMKDSGVAWIGPVPEGWSVRAFRFEFSFSKGLNITKADLVDEGVPVVSYGQIHAKYNSARHLSDKLLRFVPEAVAERDLDARLNKGDFVFADTSEDVEGAGNFVLNDRDDVVYAGYHDLIARPNDSRNSAYLAYLFQTDAWRSQLRSMVQGIKVFSITQRLLKKISLILPPLSEQRKIAAFLDGECGKIDVLRGKVEKQIAALEEYRKSVITEAVTKGIKRGRKMKPSGERWCPEIPEGWMRVNAKSLFKLRTQRAQGGDKQLTASQQHGIILQEEFMRVENQRVVTVEKDFGILKHVEPGDFVISMRSFQGGLEYSERRGCISSAYIMLIPHPTKVFPPFYKWFFKSSKYINAIQSTSNLVRDGQAMRYANFAQVPLFEIPISEQREIAAYLDRKCAAIDSMVGKCREELDRLAEYKKSLIYEYVTGKKEVA